MANGLLFKKYHIPMILDGSKTATRRTHKRPLKPDKIIRVKRDWYHFYDPPICLYLEKSYDQRLGDMTKEDAKKEGGYTLDEFRKIWIEINGAWDPDQVVRVYEFRLVKNG